MAQWLYNRNGHAKIILDGDCLRDGRAACVIGWIDRDNVYNLSGRHTGWFEHGILYDSRNDTIGFLEVRSGSLPFSPAIAVAPVTPVLAVRPVRPVLGAVRARGAFGGWSRDDLTAFLK